MIGVCQIVIVRIWELIMDEDMRIELLECLYQLETAIELIVMEKQGRMDPYYANLVASQGGRQALYQAIAILKPGRSLIG